MQIKKDQINKVFLWVSGKEIVLDPWQPKYKLLVTQNVTVMEMKTFVSV